MVYFVLSACLSIMISSIFVPSLPLYAAHEQPIISGEPKAPFYFKKFVGYGYNPKIETEVRGVVVGVDSSFIHVVPDPNYYNLLLPGNYLNPKCTPNQRQLDLLDFRLAPCGSEVNYEQFKKAYESKNELKSFKDLGVPLVYPGSAWISPTISDAKGLLPVIKMEKQSHRTGCSYDKNNRETCRVTNPWWPDYEWPEIRKDYVPVYNRGFCSAPGGNDSDCVKVGDHISIKGLYVHEHQHSIWVAENSIKGEGGSGCIRALSWDDGKGMACWGHAELHPYDMSSIKKLSNNDSENLNPDGGYTESHTVVAPLYKAYYSQTYAPNKGPFPGFGVAGRLVDSQFQKDASHDFFISAPPLPSGCDKTSCNIQVTVNQQKRGHASAAYKVDEGKAGINVHMFATGESVANPSIIMAEYTLKWSNSSTLQPKQSVGGILNGSSTSSSNTTISSINQPPQSTSNQTLQTSMNKALSVKLSGSDLEGVNLTSTIVESPQNGSLSSIDQTTGNVTYTPNSGFVGQDQLSYKVNDGVNDSTNNGTVLINVIPSSETTNDSSSESPSFASSEENPWVALTNGNDTGNDNDTTSITLANIIDNTNETLHVDTINGTLNNGNGTTFECPLGTIPNEDWGLCEPTDNLTATINGTGEFPLVDITNSTELDIPDVSLDGNDTPKVTGVNGSGSGILTSPECPEGGMIPDDLDECIFPDITPPTPDIITDGGEGNDTITNPEIPNTTCPPDTNLDDVTGLCIPPDITLSTPVPNTDITNNTTTIECPPGTAPDDITGICITLDVNEQPASEESTTTEQGEGEGREQIPVPEQEMICTEGSILDQTTGTCILSPAEQSLEQPLEEQQVHTQEIPVPAQPGIHGNMTTSETTTMELNCNDGIDDDNDGLIDLEDVEDCLQ